MRLPESEESKRRREEQVTAYFAHKPRNRVEQAALQQAVRVRIARGDIKVTPCEDAHLGPCRGSLHAHHEDYSKPWDVTFLCAAHHAIRTDPFNNRRERVHGRSRDREQRLPEGRGG